MIFKIFQDYVLIFVIVCMSCVPYIKKDELLKSEEFNFQNSTKLADHQTELFERYKSKQFVSEKEIQQLENNLWVRSAAKLAPSNLVIRQWCLIDLLRNKPDHSLNVNKFVKCMSYNKQIWCEGYSYWLYTRSILDAWVKIFYWDTNVKNIGEIITSVDMGFVKTAYKRGNLFYPAPYADIRNEPLDQKLQEICYSLIHETCTIGVVSVRYGADTVYNISAIPIGMNTHVPKNDYSIFISSGQPFGFKFYEGYDKKYETIMDETKDLLDPKRLQAIQNCN